MSGVVGGEVGIGDNDEEEGSPLSIALPHYIPKLRSNVAGRLAHPQTGP